MPLKVPRQVASKVQNGLGFFAQPCNTILLRFCNWGGSSKGMRELLEKELKSIATQNPKIVFRVKEQSGHPLVQGFYANGNSKAVCVRNMSPAKILEKINVVKNASGVKLEKYQRAVYSNNESVRGIWSPFHVAKDQRHKI